MAEKDIAAMARNIKASRRLYRVDIVARVESEDDIAFWQKAIHTARPSIKVKFLPAETSDSNVRQRGKTICMKYQDYLDKHFILCVDSDFDQFLHPGLLAPSRFILQTHAYSWENHHCQTEHLQRQWDMLACKSFNFRSFLVAFSRELYHPLLCLLTAKASEMKSWSLDSLCSCILNVQVNQRGMLDEDGKQLLKKISDNICLWEKCQEAIDDAGYKAMEKLAEGIGMTTDNTYLYMQGHCVYDLVLRIGNALCNKMYDFKCEVLDYTFYVDGYHEVNLVKSDIAQVL